MTESQTAQKVLEALKQAKAAPIQEALSLLNALIPLVQGGGGEENLEVDGARASAFLGICEVGKALHRGQPVDDLYVKAISATEQWVALVG